MMKKNLSILWLVVGLALIFSPSGATAATEKDETLLDRIHPSGDMRLRYEWDASRGGKKGDRHRARARFRIGAGIDITDELMAGFRLRTGNSDIPNSPHQTFGNSFDSWEIALDRAYLKWSPDWARGGWAQGGKMANPFKMNPVYGELVWDADINPEGGQVGYRWSGDGLALGGATGVWVLNSSDNTATIFPIQGYAECTCMDDFKVTTAVAFYKYGNMGGSGANNPSDFDPGGNRGNRLKAPIPPATDGDFKSDFEILDSFVSVTYTGLSIPVTVVGELIHNFGAKKNRDSRGWAVGAKTELPLMGRKHRVFYQYQTIRADAVFSPMAQDDFQSRASDFKGHIAGVDWGITKGVKIRTWGLFEKNRGTTGGTRSNQRVRVDINVKF
jgi:hypothetical protein